VKALFEYYVALLCKSDDNVVKEWTDKELLPLWAMPTTCRDISIDTGINSGESHIEHPYNTLGDKVEVKI